MGTKDNEEKERAIGGLVSKDREKVITMDLALINDNNKENRYITYPDVSSPSFSLSPLNTHTQTQRFEIIATLTLNKCFIKTT